MQIIEKAFGFSGERETQSEKDKEVATGNRFFTFLFWLICI